MNSELFKGRSYECSHFKVEINGIFLKKNILVSLFKIVSASWNRITKMRTGSRDLRKKLSYGDCDQYQSAPNMLGLSALVSPSWGALCR